MYVGEGGTFQNGKLIPECCSLSESRNRWIRILQHEQYWQGGRHGTRVHGLGYNV